MSVFALVVSVSAVSLLAAPAASAWTVTMTAQPKLERTYDWAIEKSVSQPAVTVEAGKTTNVTYSVTVKSTGSTDSDWSVGGNVSMTEDPNIGIAWLRVTINPDETLATVDCMPSTFPVELGLEGLECQYSAPLPDASGPRDAWMRAQSTAGNFRNVHTPFDFSAATVDEVDECVTVTDTMGGTLGTVCAADAPRTFTYTKTIGPYATSACGSQTVGNTASFLAADTGATGSASAGVAVTVKCPKPEDPCKDKDKDHDGKGHDRKGSGWSWGHDDDRCRDDDDCRDRDKGHDGKSGYDRGRGDDKCRDDDHDRDKCRDDDHDRDSKGRDYGKGRR